MCSLLVGNVHFISFSNLACHSEATSLCPPTNLLLDQSDQGRPQFAGFFQKQQIRQLRYCRDQLMTFVERLPRPRGSETKFKYKIPDSHKKGSLKKRKHCQVFRMGHVDLGYYTEIISYFEK